MIIVMMVVPMPSMLLDLLIAGNITAALLIVLVSMQVSRPLDFYGAMDGASKFVKGDAVAAIIITVINLVGGMAVGIIQRKLGPAEAVSTYSLLSIGDGLVSQIPALMLSVATGLIVTRSATEGDMGGSVVSQLSQHRRPLQIAGGAVLALCLIPALPKIPFLIVGTGVLLAAQRMKPQDDAQAAEG